MVRGSPASLLANRIAVCVCTETGGNFFPISTAGSKGSDGHLFLPRRRRANDPNHYAICRHRNAIEFNKNTMQITSVTTAAAAV